MHMTSPRPGQAPIVTCEAGRLPGRLLEVLEPGCWPLELAALPAGTALVGGAVRDALLGRLAERPDLDLVVEGDAVALARSLARGRGGSVVVLDPQRSIARLVLQGWTIDLARRQGANLEEDLLRRDYGANAIALLLPCGPSPAAVLDPGGGLGDLAAGELRTLGEANLLADPLRLLRGVRLACELGFQIEPRSWAWICSHHRSLAAVAGERVLAELERLAVAPGGGRGLARVLEADLLAGWGQPAAAGPAVQATTLEGLEPPAAEARALTAAEAAAALPLARLAVLLEGATLERLRASRRLQQRCARLRHWWQHLETGAADPDSLPEAERLRLQRDLEVDLPALALIGPAGWAPAALERWRDSDDPLFHPRAPLDGAALQENLGLTPGPQLGRLLNHLSRERAFGRLPRQASGPDPQILTAARLWLSRDAATRHG
jgi:tRNA nucleotidyltransferase (CCA-adding enzyme)